MIPGAGRLPSSAGKGGIVVRQLHVVTLSADGREVLLGARPDGRPTHSLTIDARLTRALRGEHPDGAAPSAARLSPRDIQARLRAGATVDEVAAEAGVPAARVERFAGPVRSEQEQVVGAAQAGVLRKTRAGRSALPLAEAVAVNLGAMAAAHLETASWTAAREADGRWTVVLKVTVRGRLRVARWRYDPVEREVTALDAYAGQLGFVEEGAQGRPASMRTPSSSAPAAAVSTATPVKARAKSSQAATRSAISSTTAASGSRGRPAAAGTPRAAVSAAAPRARKGAVPTAPDAAAPARRAGKAVPATGSGSLATAGSGRGRVPRRRG
jgi:hypothetical protein